MAEPAGLRTQLQERLWRQNDAKANKTGPHHTIYWVRKKKHKPGALSSEKHEQYMTGNRYTGDWVDNKKEGFGTQTWMNGNKYEGDWKNNKRHGKGTQWIRVGTKLRKQFTGDWNAGKKHGLGIYYAKSGEKYEGEWRQGLRHGRGKQIYGGGDVYEGDWSDGKRSGLGVVTYENGDRFEGYWLDDKKEGPGRYFYLSSQKMYEGEWVNDVAKCGVYMDMPPVEDEYNLGAALEAAPRDGQDSFVLPPLELKNADEEILHAVSDARRKRATDMGKAAMNAAQQAAAAAGEAAGAAAAGATAATFTKDELEQLTLAWERVDVDGRRWVLGSDLRDVLMELGIYAGADDISQLLQELGATADSQITFEEFAGTFLLLYLFFCGDGGAAHNAVCFLCFAFFVIGKEEGGADVNSTASKCCCQVFLSR